MWRKPERLRTAYQHAVLRNRDEVAAVLEELGAPTDVEFDDLAIAAVARGERPPVIPEEHDFDQQEALMLARDLTVVIERFGPDLTGVVGGSPRVPLIMHAAYLGDVERVRLLLAAGAKPDAWHALVEGSQSDRDRRAAPRRRRGHRPGRGGTGRLAALRVARSTIPTLSPNAA